MKNKLTESVVDYFKNFYWDVKENKVKLKQYFLRK